jgi:hypothetical protein
MLTSDLGFDPVVLLYIAKQVQMWGKKAKVLSKHNRNSFGKESENPSPN